MADEGRSAPINAERRSERSDPSTRRGSEVSGRDNNMTSSGQLGTSGSHSLETPRRRPAPLQTQTEGYGMNLLTFLQTGLLTGVDPGTITSSSSRQQQNLSSPEPGT